MPAASVKWSAAGCLLMLDDGVARETWLAVTPGRWREAYKLFAGAAVPGALRDALSVPRWP